MDFFDHFNELLHIRQVQQDSKFERLRITQIQPEEQEKKSFSFSLNIDNIKIQLQTIIFQFNNIQFLKFNNDFISCIHNLSIIQKNISSISVGSPLPLIPNHYLPEQYVVVLQSQNNIQNDVKQVLANNQNNVFILFRNNKY
jgi:hypothetical protein